MLLIIFGYTDPSAVIVLCSESGLGTVFILCGETDPSAVILVKANAADGDPGS